MENNGNLLFATIEEELNYWKRRCEMFEINLEQCQTEKLELENQLKNKEVELEDYQTTSQEYERELEEENENLQQIKEVNSKKLSNLSQQYDQLKEKYKRSQLESFQTIGQLQETLECRELELKEQRNKIQELEFYNDQLQMHARASEASYEFIEEKYQEAIEKSVFLENDAEEKKKLVIEVQRLKDEIRDLNLELSVRDEEIISTYVVVKRNESRKPIPSFDGTRSPTSPPQRMLEKIITRVQNLDHSLSKCRDIITTSTSNEVHPEKNTRRTSLPPFLKIRMDFNKKRKLDLHRFRSHRF